LATVFLSYSRLDGDIAGRIADVLSDQRVTFFHDINDVPPGADFYSVVTHELLECRAVLVVLSRASLQSGWVHYELGCGSAWRKLILPYVTEPGLNLPIYLSRLNHLTSVESVREFFKHWQPRDPLPPIFVPTEKPPDALTGEWSGTGHQLRGPDNQPIDWSLNLCLRPNGNQIEGEMLMHGTVHGERYQVYFDITGGVVGGRFAWLNYLARDASRAHFGTVVLDLNRDELIGEYTGYGALTRGVVSGYVRLKKGRETTAATDVTAQA
jgi:hypothetical protein